MDNSHLRSHGLFFGVKRAGMTGLPPVRLAFSLCVFFLLLFHTVTPVSASFMPTISIVNVVVDQSVTVRTNHFPENQSFTIRMGEMGTQGVDGIVIDTIQTGQGGVMDITCQLPHELKGKAQIAIRLESDGGYFAYNWFYNNTSSSAVGASPAGGVSYSGIPAINILLVDEERNVTIMGINFPAYQMFTVRMGQNGTQGIGGRVVAVTDTGLGGAFEVTYQVPQELFSQSKVAIRLENENGYYSYNWFYTGASQAMAVSYEDNAAAVMVYPTMSILSVVQDQSVTFQAHRLPQNQTCTVFMGYMGSKGLNGVAAGTINAGSADTVNATIQIPAPLVGQGRIAIRIEAPGGYYAYNWFYNTSTY